MGLFDFFKTKKEIRVNDFFNIEERKQLIKATFSVGDTGKEIRNHIQTNGILNDSYFEILQSLLDVKFMEMASSGIIGNKDFVDLYSKIKNHSSSAK
jgi:hypothetical protein